jgi:toxin-antitoxin system PIN domain toxin
MKRCLVDVNVLLALLVRHHEHHKMAVKWFDKLAAGEAGLCRSVQLALIRLLGNRAVMGEYAVSALAAWKLIDDLMQDERLYFVAEPDGVDSVFPGLLRYPISTGKLVGDAWLAAMSIAVSTKLVTLDSGFRQFKGLDVTVLAR